MDDRPADGIVACQDCIEHCRESMRNCVVERCAVLGRTVGDICGEATERPRSARCRQLQLAYELEVELESLDLGAVLRERQCEHFLSSAAAGDPDEEAGVLEQDPDVESRRCDG